MSPVTKAQINRSRIGSRHRKAQEDHSFRPRGDKELPDTVCVDNPSSLRSVDLVPGLSKSQNQISLAKMAYELSMDQSQWLDPRHSAVIGPTQAICPTLASIPPVHRLTLGIWYL